MIKCRDDVEALTAPSSNVDDTPELFDEMLGQLSGTMEIHTSDGSTANDTLCKAMNYSLGLRGKRARGLLVLLVMEGWGKAWRSALNCAKAVEMVHTASLIIDDLPSMDDATMRRGKATNHVRFGEPVAILAAISLISEALKLLASSPELSAEQRHLAVKCLASAIGPDGMSGGQVLDLAPTGHDAEVVELTHALKTGTLFAAAAELGCIAANLHGPHKWLLSDFGMLLGKAFQEFDDLIDVVTSQELAGKDTLKDGTKPTIVGLIGVERAERRALEQIASALECLEASGIQTDGLSRFTLDLTRAMRTMIHIEPIGRNGA